MLRAPGFPCYNAPHMPENNDKEKGSHFNRLDSLGRRLYSKDPHALRGHREGILHPTNAQVKNAWAGIKEPASTLSRIKLPASVFKKFFIFSAIFFVMAVGFALYSFLGGTNTVSNQNIDIAVLGNTFAAGGEDLPLQIEITNKNTVALELADLIVAYPKGTAQNTEGTTEQTTLRYSLDRIPAGKVVTQDIDAILFGEEGSTRDIKISLEYRLAGSNAIFEKNKIYTVTLNSAPIALSVDGPEEINTNQKITLAIKTTVNAKKPVEGVLLKVDYPPGFKFEEASPKPTSFDNVWNLGDLAPGSEHVVNVTGTVLGQDGEARTFHVYTGSADTITTNSIGVVYNSLSHIMTIVKPFIEATIIVNGLNQDNIVIDSERQASAQIVWANNLPTRITDAVLAVTFSGNALDLSSIKTGSGFYDSNKQTVIWDKTTVPELGAIEPGERGSVDFSFESLPLLSGSLLLKDPTITIAVDIKGKEPSAGGIQTEITNATEKSIKINSDFQIGAEASYSTGPFANTGPLQPHAGVPTTYTITWTLTNSANPITLAKASSTLPTYVRWVGTSAPPAEKISYDASSRAIVWDIGSVSSGIGYTGSSRSVSFQVELLPSTSQIGSVPQLLLETALTGIDSFTKSTINESHASLNTRLPNDPAFVAGSERVTN